MSLKDQVINQIIQIEGGYVNDPSDSGGETNFGITKRVARNYGYKGDMRYLPRSLAFEIYSNLYWDSLLLDGVQAISPRIAKELADTGVNMGTGRAARFLQRALNALNNRQQHYPDLKIDGALGQRTLNALRQLAGVRGEAGMKVLYKMLNSLQGEFYVDLAERREKDERFIFGWFANRVT